jgi:hypothetical protein
MISCKLDRTTNNLCTLKVDQANGQAGSYSLGYIIEMQSACGPLEVLLRAQAGTFPDQVPALWSTYSFSGDTDTHSYCKSLSVSRDPKATRYYYVTASFEPAAPGEIPEAGAAPVKATVNPVNRKPVFWWDRNVSSNIEPLNSTGYAQTSYAGTPYEDLTEQDRAKALLVAEFNVATLAQTIDLTRNYDHSTNAQAWTLKGTAYAARSAHIKEVCASPLQSEGSYSFYKISMRFAFADAGKTWDVPKVEMSYHYYTKTSGVYDVDAYGYRKRIQSDSLVPINADGTRRDDAQPILVTQNRVIREVDFNQLTILNA